MASKITRPVLSWPGGKFRIADWVIGHFPKHEVYIEPFAGAASVLLRKPPSRIEILNDVDESIVSLFRVLRDPDYSRKLIAALELTPFSRAEYAMSWVDAADPAEKARRLIVRSFQSLGCKNHEEKNGWRTRTAKSIWSPCTAWNGYPKALPAIVERLKNTIIESNDWRKVFEIYDDPATLFYCDPPYPHPSRKSAYKDVYQHEMTDADHEELCSRASKLKGFVILSSYRNDLYDKLLAGWRRSDIKARAQTNSPRMESIYINPRASLAIQPELFAETA